MIHEGSKSFRFNGLQDIKDNLTKYVADVRYAHAMQEVRLYTQDLARVDDIMFCDVPGLNSGLDKHIEDTKRILADCDAIIMAQRNISLDDYE